jgi:hypothetical protein
MPQLEVLAHVLEHFWLDPGAWALNCYDGFEHGTGKLQLYVRVQMAALLDQVQEHLIECLSKELLLVSVQDVPVLPEKFCENLL